jgi:phage baseplate assembly protein W
MARQQLFGIKYPFTHDDYQNFFVDANTTEKDKVRSQIMHVIFTPKGQRIRMPEFGTDLIKYIFSPNDSESWESVKNEITSSVQRFVPNVILNDVRVVQSEDERAEIFVRMDYTIKEGNRITKDSIITQI